MVVFPGNTGSGRQGKLAVEIQAIIAQRLEHLWLPTLEEDGGSTPHARNKTLRRFGIVRESRTRHRDELQWRKKEPNTWPAKSGN